MVQFGCRVRRKSGLVQFGPWIVSSPGPNVSEPYGGKKAKIGGLGSTIGDRDLDKDVFEVSLGIFHKHIEVAVVVEHSGIEQLKLSLVLATTAVLVHQLAIGKLGLRILVKMFHVRVRGGAVEIEVILLYIFAV